MLVACVAVGRVTKSAGIVRRFTVSATQGIKLLVESMFVSQTVLRHGTLPSSSKDVDGS